MIEGGVTFIDPAHAYISSDAQVGRDCVIHPDVHIEGKSVIGEGCEIQPGSRIKDSRLGDRVTIKDHCLIVDSEIGDDCAVGPFAHLRMNARMEERAVVGNFVEVKKSKIGRGTKSMHLTYLGDATIGEDTNIGAGTVTCNYDGKHKHPTVIGSRVRIGSDTMLVAPVCVGDGAVTAAGSVVTEDVPPDTLVAGVPAKIKKSLTEEAES
jgi:bifunctional UDP-N-acetylglucosamine pyrophosphorylase/glucosamine-1-phosphate N-acetyltransferase